MRIFGLVILGAAALAPAVFGADAKQAPQADPSQAQIDDIIQKFAAKEADFAKARENYTYRQTARDPGTGPTGTITGRWETVSDIVFNPDGKRTRK